MLLRKEKRLFFAIVLTAIVISGQFFPNITSFTDTLDQVAASASTDSDEHGESTHITYLSPAYTVIPILKLQVAACFYLVQELVLLCELEQKTENSPPLNVNHFFRTLFRHIIAPNAP